MPSKASFTAGATPRPTAVQEFIPDGGTTTSGSSGTTITKAPEPVSVTIASQPSFSTEERDQYRAVRDWAKDAYGFSSVADLDSRTKWAADKFYAENGRWPSATEMWAYQPFHDSLSLLASGGAYMERYFGIREPGSTTRYFSNNTFEWTELNEADSRDAWFLMGGDKTENMMAAGWTVPRYTPDQLADILGSLSPISGGVGGSGGGSGGAGRAALAFDRAQLAEEATNRWRGLLLEEPDQATLDSLVGDYISEANAFWMKEAGRLDYDTYVVDRVRSTDRHTFLYDKKPEFQSEAEYMGGFRQTVGQFGFNDRAALRETEAGAHSGVGLAGFGERVGRTSEARLASTGSYSQRFAQSMASSGLGRT